MVYNDVLFSVWYELFFTQICNPPALLFFFLLISVFVFYFISFFIYFVFFVFFVSFVFFSALNFHFFHIDMRTRTIEMVTMETM